jgi:hypothetical protein
MNKRACAAIIFAMVIPAMIVAAVNVTNLLWHGQPSAPGTRHPPALGARRAVSFDRW